MTRNRLYALVLTICAAGFVWLAACVVAPGTLPGGCLVHWILGLPCPACGMTTSVAAVVRGHLFESLWHNPLGIFMLACGVTFPVWITADLMRRGDSFHRFYLLAERRIATKFLWPAIIVIGSVWVWNLIKHFFL